MHKSEHISILVTVICFASLINSNKARASMHGVAVLHGLQDAPRYPPMGSCRGGLRGIYRLAKRDMQRFPQILQIHHTRCSKDHSLLNWSYPFFHISM